MSGDAGYLLVADAADARDPAVEAALAALLRSGWTLRLDGFGLRILTGPRFPWPVAQVHRAHALIGEWRGEGAHPSAIAGRFPEGRPLGAGLMSEGWGAYLMVWRDRDGHLNLVRDPTGAVDVVWWRRGPVTLVTDCPPPALDAVLPDTLAIDWPQLGALLATPSLLTDGLPLQGLTPVGAGCWSRPDQDLPDGPLWRPADFVRRGADDAPDALVRVVDRTIDRTMRSRRRVVSELSGGLDSAIVAGSLRATGHAERAVFINYYGDDAEGDERRYAEAAAALSGVPLETVRKPVEAISDADFTTLASGLRPALQGVDPAYDRHAAGRLAALGADGLLTGQGGDSVFFQAPDPLVAADRFRRQGLRALNPAYLAAVGRWTRHSAWTVGRLAVRGRTQTGSGPRHRWLDDAAELAPAKRGQLERFVNCQLFWTDCLRARQAPLLNPFLSQPVVEHCLGVPSDRLTLGERDRGLARLAFSERLPPLIAERRDKGDLSHFYGQVVRDSAPALAAFLLEGRLAAQGVLDRATLEVDLDPARLLWREGANAPLLAAVLEAWARHWEGRIARRRTEVARQPVEDVGV